MRVTNNSDVSLTLAVWLLSDTYDYINEQNYISVTTLMRPLRQIILPSRVPPSERHEDVVDYIARKLGNALHDSIEKTWTHNYVGPLKRLGYNDAIINRLLINPEWDELDARPDAIPVYLEQRATREFFVDGTMWKVGGKFDMVAEGRVEDNKSTSAMSWVYGTRDEEHQLQGSLYRWIDAGQTRQKITEDTMRINYIFTDWQKFSAKTNPKYPQKRVEKKDIALLGVAQTEDWVSAKLEQVGRHLNTPEKDLPECTDEELWRSEPKYSYYSDPNKTDGRSTKNFDTLQEANAFCAEKGKGIVITKPSEPKRCGFCNAFPVCTQKDRYFA